MDNLDLEEYEEALVEQIAKKLSRALRRQLLEVQLTNQRLADELRQATRRQNDLRAEMADQGTVAAPEPPSRSVMVGLWLAPDVAQQLAIPNGVPAEVLHITLAYLGKENWYSSEAFETLKEVIAGFAQTYYPIDGVISGVGRFSPESDEQMDVFYLSYDSSTLSDLRYELWEALNRSGFIPDRTHGFTPHITLAYIPRSTPSPMQSIDPIPLSFSALTLAVGTSEAVGDNQDFPFQESESVAV